MTDSLTKGDVQQFREEIRAEFAACREEMQSDPRASTQQFRWATGSYFVIAGLVLSDSGWVVVERPAPARSISQRETREAARQRRMPT